MANAQGNHNTPSVVAFQDAEQLVGEVAVQQAAKNQANTITEAKRLLGKKHDDPSVVKDNKRWNLAMANKDGKAGVTVNFKGAKAAFTAEHVCSAVIGNLKATAEAFVHSPVKNCVLAAPIVRQNPNPSTKTRTLHFMHPIVTSPLFLQSIRSCLLDDPAPLTLFWRIAAL